MNPCVEKALVVTTGHVPEAVCNRLEQDYASMVNEYGLILPVHDEIRWQGLHDNLRQLACHALEAGCYWLWLDRDADGCPGVSVYDW